MIGVANDNLWRKFCRIADLDDIVDNPKFRTNANRVVHRAETLALVQTALAKQPVGYWNDSLSEVGVPCSPINTLKQLLDHPHTQASGIILDYEHPLAGPTQAVGQPILLDDEARSAGLPPPVPGQHTDEVLAELGLSASEIEKLRETKVVA